MDVYRYTGIPERGKAVESYTYYRMKLTFWNNAARPTFSRDRRHSRSLRKESRGPNSSAEGGRAVS